MLFWFASFSWWLWFRPQVKKYLLHFSSFIKTLFNRSEMKSVFSRSDFSSSIFRGSSPSRGISVISELTPKFIWWSHLKSVFTHEASVYAKSIGTKERICIWEKSSTPTGLVSDTNMAAVSLFWDTNMAAVTLCENTLIKLCVNAHVPDLQLTTS